MHLRSGALVAAALFLSRSALAADDAWTPDDFDNVTSTPAPPPIWPTPGPRRQLEPRAAPFGARGQVAIFGGTSIGISGLSYESGAGETRAALEPAVMYFVARNLAVGVNLELYFDNARYFDASGNLFQTKTVDFFAGPQLSYNVVLSRYVSWFPGASINFGVVSKQQRIVNPAPATTPSLATHSNTEADSVVRVQAPLLFHLAQHFLVGAGPTFSHDLAKTEGDPDIGTQTTRIGGGLYVAGYLGGAPPAEEEKAAPPRRYESHLGTDHTIVFRNDLNLAGGWTSLPPSHSTSGAFSAGGSFDFFVKYGVSLGAGGAASVAHYTGTYATTGKTYTQDQYGLSISGELGYLLRLSTALSLYPRASLALGTSDYTLRSNGKTNEESTGIVHVALVAPLDVELAPHFFVGLGPYVAYDLANEDQYSRENRLTSLGAAFEIGTWL